jgi:hypothetical protein
MIIAKSIRHSRMIAVQERHKFPGFFSFPELPYTELRSDRRLVIKIFWNLFAPFRGANASSNPAAGALLSMIYARRLQMKPERKVAKLTSPVRFHRTNAILFRNTSWSRINVRCLNDGVAPGGRQILPEGWAPGHVTPSWIRSPGQICDQ